jgi:transcriptional regulator
MYIPKTNLTTNKNEIVAFMQRFSFASIVTTKDNFPTATHLPFLITLKEDEVVLTSHFAKANEQWKDVEAVTNLVIFNEPHAYISPTHYDTALNVPTWNYIAVHAYGQAKLITEPEKTLKLLEATIDNYEPAYRQQWDNMPEDFKTKMAKGIVAFEIVVTDLQAKKKLSQNKSDNEKEKIVAALSKSDDTNEKLIAEYMQNDM